MLAKVIGTWQGRRRLERLPQITVNTMANYYKAFTAPNPDYEAVILNSTGDEVGTATYAVSPVFDRVYLFEIEITPEHRRQGYATAMLWHLAKTYGQPITAVKELYSANSFWTAARQLKKVGLVVTMQLSVGDMDNEAARWQHLRSEAERLEKLISERLMVHNEPWHIAVGRGLDS
jgi:GNAT superfamily N-acetyltransferase